MKPHDAAWVGQYPHYLQVTWVKERNIHFFKCVLKARLFYILK